MGLLRYTRRAAAITLAAAILAVPPARALDLRDSRLAATCDADGAGIMCRYRCLAEGAPSSVRLTVGGRPIAGTVPTPYPRTGAVAAVLFLVDTSDPARGAAVRRSIGIVNELAARTKPYHRLGLAHFDSDLGTDGGTAAETPAPRPRGPQIPPPASSRRPGPGGAAPWWPYAVGGVLLVLAGATVYGWSRRRPPPTTDRGRGRHPRRRTSESREVAELTFADEPSPALTSSGRTLGGEDRRPSTGILGYLELRRPAPDPPAYYPVTSSAFRMGRSSDNHLTLKDPSVSRHHAEIHMHRDGTFTVMDLESMNGVYVNDRRVRRSAKLHEGDRLELGDLSLTFTFRAPEPTGEETLVLSERDLTAIDLDFSDKGAA